MKPRSDVFRGVSIDHATTRLIDDAFRVERTTAGGWRAMVAFPRIDSTCPTGSTGDLHARAAPWSRGSRPMFPAGLASAMSLAPQGRRDAFLVTIETDGRCRTMRTTFERTAFEGEGRLDEHAVGEILRDAAHPLHAMIADAAEMASLLAARGKRGNGRSGRNIVSELATLVNAELAGAARDAGLAILYSGDAIVGGQRCVSATPDPDRPYARFTSPLWRYVDVVNQRILEDVLDGVEPRYDAASVAMLADEMNEAARDHATSLTTNPGRAKAVALARRDLRDITPGTLRSLDAARFKMLARVHIEDGAGSGPQAWLTDEALTRLVALDPSRLQPETAIALALTHAPFAARLCALLSGGGENARHYAGLCVGVLVRRNGARTDPADADEAGFTITLEHRGRRRHAASVSPVRSSARCEALRDLLAAIAADDGGGDGAAIDGSCDRQAGETCEI